jgi:hypothetical protein
VNLSDSEDVVSFCLWRCVYFYQLFADDHFQDGEREFRALLEDEDDEIEDDSHETPAVTATAGVRSKTPVTYSNKRRKAMQRNVLGAAPTPDVCFGVLCRRR